MDAKTRILFERMVAAGFHVCEAEFQAKWHPKATTHLLKGFRRERRTRCLEPGCDVLVPGLKLFCEEHEFKHTLAEVSYLR